MSRSRWEALPSRPASYDTKALIHGQSSRSPSTRRDKFSKGSLQSDADKKPMIYISDDEDYPGVNNHSEPITISDDDDAELTR